MGNRADKAFSGDAENFKAIFSTAYFNKNSRAGAKYFQEILRQVIISEALNKIQCQGRKVSGIVGKPCRGQYRRGCREGAILS